MSGNSGTSARRILLCMYSGEILQFMPLAQRFDAVTYFCAARADAPAFDYNVWTAYDSVRECDYARLARVYGVGSRMCDASYKTHERISVFEGGGGGDAESRRCVVRKSGIPVAWRDVIACVRRSREEGRAPLWTLAVAFPFVYVFEDARAPHGWACYLRVLECGRFVKISSGDVRHSHAAASVLTQRIDVFRAAMSHGNASGKVVDDLRRSTLTDMERTLSDASAISMETESLLRLIMATRRYNEMYVLQSGESLKTRRSWAIDRNGCYARRETNTANVGAFEPARTLSANTRMAPRACAVGKCSLVPRNADAASKREHHIKLTVCFRHVMLTRRGSDDDEAAAHPEVKYNFCERHGDLVVAAWYLYHVRRIWTATFYDALNMGNRREVRVYNTAAEAVYQFLEQPGVRLREYRERFEACLRCVTTFTRDVRLGLARLRTTR